MSSGRGRGKPARVPPSGGVPTEVAAGPTGRDWGLEVERAAAALDRNRRLVNAGETYAGKPAQTWKRRPRRQEGRMR